jgi:L-seryl-tRNA(Ser) seleniumtransferase
MLAMPLEEVRRRCERLKMELTAVLPNDAFCAVEQESSEVGSGSLAAVSVPTWIVSLSLSSISAEEIARKLRLVRVPVFGRIKEQKFLLDGRTIRDDELALIAQGFKEIVS